MTFETVGTEERDGARVADIRIEVAPAGGANKGARAGEPIEAYLVEPSAATSRAGPGLLFAHWYDPHAPNGDRTEFLDEAVGWATERGATAILPQLTFPWRADPVGSSADLARIQAEVARLRQCLDVLVASRGVDPAHIGVVGHDFGAMHAVLLATADGRPEQVGRLAPARLLFQFADRDFYIAPMAGFEFRRAAGDQAEVKSYEAEHDMASPAALADRTAFLEDALGLADPTP